MTVYRSIDSNSCLSCTHKTFIVTLTQLSCNVDICNSINITYQSINVTNQELQKHESVYRSLHIYEILLLLQHSQTLESFVNLHKQFLVISKYLSIIFFPSTSLFLFLSQAQNHTQLCTEKTLHTVCCYNNSKLVSEQIQEYRV